MVWKDAFIYTLREVPSEAETISHKLMLRAGMIQKVSAGIYNYLPLGLRVIQKVETIIRQEMGKCHATELLMPMVIPAELWQESGRWEYYGPELLRLTDRKRNPFLLGPTHEEVIDDLVRKTVRSYRDLPVCLFQIQTKFRDEVRPRYGLMRGREFIMKDAYSFHATEASLEETYRAMYNAYSSIFSRCGLDFRPVEADSGNIGGSVTHEFHVLADAGEDTIAFCDSCDYAANLEKAAARLPLNSPASNSNPQPVDVATPGKTSIEDVAAFLGVDARDSVKMLIYKADAEYYVAVCIRGDLTVNEVKLRTVLGAKIVEIPSDEEVKGKLGLVVGYMGPRNLPAGAVREVIGDVSVRAMDNAVCGANKDGYHLTNINPSRDCTFSRFEDVAVAREGDCCPRCDNGRLRMRKGIEVGQVFKLGRKYSKPMSLTFLNDKDSADFMTMGCYGIGVGRTAAAAVEQHNDENGIIWPAPIAPYSAIVLCLDAGSEETLALSKSIHDALEQTGIDVLLDDRPERPGVKFKDADLIGIPFRITVGLRGIKDGVVEVKRRKEKTIEKISKDSCVETIVRMISES